MATKKEFGARGADDGETGSGSAVRRRWHKYAGIKPERGRGRLKSIAEEVASLSNLEAEAMDILWDLGRPASAMEVLEFSLYKHREQGEEPVSFPALQSTLRRLAEKNILVIDREDYRAIRYVPLVAREEMAARILNNVSMKLLGQPFQGLLPQITGKLASH